MGRHHDLGAPTLPLLRHSPNKNILFGQPKTVPQGLYVVNEDFLLAQKATKGDRDAMGRLVDRYRASLFRTAFYELSRYEDAQDAVAESIVRACRFIGRLKNPDQFAPWIHAIVRNEARRIRARMLRREYQTAHLSPATAQGKALDELRGNVRQAIADLPTDQAYALQAFYLEGATVKEISQILARPEGTVKWMLSRGRGRLTELLKEFKPMTDEIVPRAVLVTPNFEPSYQIELSTALKRGGWGDVRIVSDPTEFVRYLTPGQDALPVPELVRQGDFIVLSERVGNITAWELMPFLHTLRKRVECPIMLILEDGRTREEANVAAWSAYVSGMDLLLTRPLSLDEFTSFVKRVLPKR